MAKTKIVCTLGPATDNIETLTKLIEAGMDMARLNFSHGNKEERDARIELLIQARKITGKNIPILIDTKGIKIRTGYVQGYSDSNKKATITLEKGKSVIFTCDATNVAAGGIPSTAERIYIDYDELPEQIKIGQNIMLDDGLITTEVTKINGKDIVAKIRNSGTIVSRRSVNLPGVRLTLDAVTNQDMQDILYGLTKDIDFVALSFVKRMNDVVQARKFLDANGGQNVMIISKIENQEGVENLDEILAVSDGVMVARGDMAIEIPYSSVPAIQKQMIRKALAARKIVITATQMLHSMIKEPTPTRAEVSDIFNATQDSTSCIMLSGETANGDYPLEAVTVMNTVAQSGERALDYKERFFSNKFDANGHVTTSICHAAISTAYQVRAKAIIAYSESGLTAKRISSLRPQMPVIVMSKDDRVVRQCHALWGITPVHQTNIATVEELYTHAMEIAISRGLIEDGDSIVVVAGSSVGVSGSTNAIRVMTQGDVIVRGMAMSDSNTTGTIKVCKDIDDLQALNPGQIAALYRMDEEVMPYLTSMGGILLAGTDYDENVMNHALGLGLAVIIDVQGLKMRLHDDMEVSVLGTKGVVLHKK